MIPAVVKFVHKRAMLGTDHPPRRGGEELVHRVVKAGEHDSDASTAGDTNTKRYGREASEDAMWGC